MFKPYEELLHFSPLVSLRVRTIQDTSSIMCQKSLAIQITEFRKIHFLTIFLFFAGKSNVSAVFSYYA